MKILNVKKIKLYILFRLQKLYVFDTWLSLVLSIPIDFM